MLAVSSYPGSLYEGELWEDTLLGLSDVERTHRKLPSPGEEE